MTDNEVIAVARRRYMEDGVIEIDHGAHVDHTDNGAWVSAKVWVGIPVRMRYPVAEFIDD